MDLDHWIMIRRSCANFFALFWNFPNFAPSLSCTAGNIMEHSTHLAVGAVIPTQDLTEKFKNERFLDKLNISKTMSLFYL